KALRDRHIIISKEGEKGTYRLQHKGFARWIRMYADPDYWKEMIEKLVDQSMKERAEKKIEEEKK
ncbi:MAG: hypothetical protein QME74_09920, partial [Candidatus Edwardsbacteria bacterium]|nr:hypothetical protein [Candidatus Edwardsbacteria bacterium]